MTPGASQGASEIQGLSVTSTGSQRPGPRDVLCLEAKGKREIHSRAGRFQESGQEVLDPALLPVLLLRA